jgi:hypothetical protein
MLTNASAAAEAAAAAVHHFTQAWIWQLYQAMRSGATGLRPLLTNLRREVSRMQQHKCVPSTTAGFDF